MVFRPYFQRYFYSYKFYAFLPANPYFIILHHNKSCKEALKKAVYSLK